MMELGFFSLLYALWAALVALVVYGLHPIKRWRYRHLPGPPFRWLLGHLPEIVKEGQDSVQERWAEQYGSPFLMWVGALPVVVVSVPDQARKVLGRPTRQKFAWLHTGEEGKLDSYSIVFSRSLDLWKAARGAWQPFFSADSLAALVPTMKASAARLAAHLQPAAAAGKPVDIWRELGLMTMDVVGTTAFGVDFNTLERAAQQKEAEAGEATALTSPIVALFVLCPEGEQAWRWLANALPTPGLRTELKARGELRAVGTELIEQQLALTAGGKGGSAAQGGNDGSSCVSAAAHARPAAIKPGSFLSLVLPSLSRQAGGDTLGPLWAVSQGINFILAGYETTANAIAYAVYLLAGNPDKEAKLLAEIDGWGRHKTLPSAADLPSALPYTAAVVREALRMYPPAAIAAREMADDVTLGDRAVPGGVPLQVSITAMHRSPRLWRDPQAFLPERFMPGTREAAEVTPGAYLPFGDGPRKCIGWRFALQEAALSLAALYQQYTFRLTPGQVPLKTKMVLTSGPADGVHVTVHRRE
ncbi:cytochrome P450 isoform A [Micractinium conductrix]|uniref:Cytochrome P450 isoform A n=1 Tax=Micractinium conductrix TaxID=554055 RepID=A0A2P6VR78_9CHLO|nr:cytochrome P450 isoform A [Micractinium conductrix]|eukprot:PSC76582.1 cytochrome P450 isoform A [Micractinium conductrix]